MQLFVYILIGFIAVYILLNLDKVARLFRERTGGDSREQAIDAFEQQNLADLEAAGQEPDGTPDPPHVPERFPEWMAVKSTNPGQVAHALGIEDGQPCNWASGIAITASGAGLRTWVSGEAKGWVFIRGSFLMPEPDDPDKGILNILRELSRQFGEAQYFVFLEAMPVNGWAKAEHGEIVRAYYVWANENKVVWNRGEITDGERAAGCVYEEGSEPCKRDDAVDCIAAQWSVDPTKLGEQELPTSVGVVGHTTIEGLASETGD